MLLYIVFLFGEFSVKLMNIFSQFLLVTHIVSHLHPGPLAVSDSSQA